MKGRLKTEGHRTPGKRRCILVTSLLVGTLLGTLIVTSGCAVIPRRRRRRKRAVVVTTPAGSIGVIYVQKAPPKARTEVRPRRPNRRAVWVPGHWQWNGKAYVWKPGHWDARPGGETWAPGHWEKRSRGHVWVPGHWR